MPEKCLCTLYSQPALQRLKCFLFATIASNVIPFSCAMPPNGTNRTSCAAPAAINARKLPAPAPALEGAPGALRGCFAASFQFCWHTQNHHPTPSGCTSHTPLSA